MSYLIAQFIREQGLSEGLLAVNIYNALNEAVGQENAKYLTNKEYKDKKLYCAVNSSLVRQTLYPEKAKIIARINEIIGNNVVEEIIFR